MSFGSSSTRGSSSKSIFHSFGSSVIKLARFLGVNNQTFTEAEALADTNLFVGATVVLSDRAYSKWDAVLASGVTPNGKNILQCTGVGSLALVLRYEGGEIKAAALGVLIDDLSKDHAEIINWALPIYKSVRLPDGKVKTTKPVVVPVGCTLQGTKNVSAIDKTTVTSYTSGLTGYASAAPVYMEGNYNFRSKLSGFDIFITAPSILDCGLFVGKTAQSLFEDININVSPLTASEGVVAKSAWLSKFARVRVGGSNGYAYNFNMLTSGLGTSLVLEHCYAEAAGGGLTMSGVTYSTINSCGFDYINSGGRPANPYGAGAGGDYLAQSYVFKFSACDVTISGCGTENSSANLLYNEGSSLIFNTLKVDSLKNYVTTAQDIIGARGVAASHTEFNACDMAVEDTIGNARGIRIETPSAQKIEFTQLPRFTGFGTGKALFSMRNTDLKTVKSKIMDRAFESNVPPLETPFTVWYESGSHVDNDLVYVPNATNGSKELRFSGDTGAAALGATINTHWRYYVNLVDKPATKLVLSIKGTYGTGGYGNPSISIREASNTTSTGALIASYPVANLAAGDYIEVDLTGVTLSAVYLDITILYKGSFVNAEMIDLFTY